MAEIAQTISPIGAGTARPGGPNLAASRPVIEQSVGSEGIDRGTTATGRPVIDQTVTPGGSGGSLFSAKAKEMLAALDKPESVEKPAPVAETPAAAPPVETPTAAPVAATTEPPPAPDQSVHERLMARNAELVKELEGVKSRPQREFTPREKRLIEAEATYADDPAKALRLFLAAVHDVEDINSPDVNSELTGLYQDLTERELQVAPDDATKAKRESARTRLMLKRDRRENAAAAPAPVAPSAPPDEHIALVGTHFKPLATDHPLLTALAPQPEAAILARIHQGFATGEYDRKTKDAELIRAAAKDLETQYQVLADKISKARPQPSTATPTIATETAKQEASQSKAAPSITNASASVAPATPPAKQPSTTTPDDDFRKLRPGETEFQRRLRIAKRHMPD